MNCSKCGTLNSSDSKFCMTCGQILNEEPQVIETPVQPTNVEPVYNQPVYTEPVISNKAKEGTVNVIKYVIGILLKPFKSFKDEEEKFTEPKNSIILAGIIAAAMMLIKLLTSIINVIFVKKFDVSTFKYKTSIDFSQVLELDYISLIGKNLLIYAGIIAGIALIYYLASLIIKKEVNYVKTLAITATSFIPYIVLGMIASPLLGKIWGVLSIVAIIIGLVYSLMIFFTLIKEEIEFEDKDSSIYFHSACVSVILIAGYYICMKLLTETISGGLGDYLDFFN